jgi:hypothetical protein
VPAGLSGEDKKRFEIVREILTTEQSYTHCLSLMLKVTHLFFTSLSPSSSTSRFPAISSQWVQSYQEPLSKCVQEGKPIISLAEIKTIFSIAEILYNFHQGFARSLEERVVSWTATATIGDVFLQNVRAPLSRLFGPSDLLQVDFFRVYSTYVV